MRADVWCTGSRRPVMTFFMAAALALVGCGDSRSAHESPEFDRLGVACGEARHVDSSEVILDDAAPECGDGFCLNSADVARGAPQSQGICSCRCDGEEGTGPFCGCSEGFVCREQVRALGMASKALAGSYCVPAP